MSTIEPRSVPPSSCLGWLREGTAIAREGWVAYLVSIVIACALIEGVPEPLTGYLVLLLGPAFCAWLVAIAAGTDMRWPLAQTFQTARVALLRLILAASVLLVQVGVMVALALAYGGASEPSVRPELPSTVAPWWLNVDAFPAGSGMLFVFGIVMSMTMLVGLPLLVRCPQCSVEEACFLILRANDKNWFILPLALAVLLASLMGALFNGVVVFLLMPAVASTCYVAWRHIFLGEPPMRRIAVAVERRGAGVARAS